MTFPCHGSVASTASFFCSSGKKYNDTKVQIPEHVWLFSYNTIRRRTFTYFPGPEQSGSIGSRSSFE